jgi:hypothetical protein
LRAIKASANEADSRKTMRVSVPRLLLLVCAALAVVPATADAAKRSSAPATPRVVSVTPLKLRVGDKMTIRGTGFLKGKNRNTVVFKADGQRAVFVKAQSATTTRLVIQVPAKLGTFLKTTAGQPVATRFRLRVLARKLSKAYTPAKESPVIAAQAAPASASAGATTPAAATAPAAASTPAASAATPPPPPPDCDADGTPDATDADDDNDLLPDAVEATIGTDRCNLDSDADGLTDGFEYESAYDLNGNRAVVSFPKTAPYPNPLNGDDTGFDFDGDGMTLREEYILWRNTGARLPLSYSDGDQDSTGTTNSADRTARLSVIGGIALDRDGDGFLTDDEKDADADGLTNWEETHGPMIISWWAAKYQGEKQFAGRPGAAPLYETSFIVQDSDGDGIADGTDDQDHDDISNVNEISRDATLRWVHVYNPCLPNPDSRTCSRYVPFSEPWAPAGAAPKLGDSATNLVWPRS